MYTCKTYEELEKIVNDWLNGDDDDSMGTVHQSSSSPSPSPAAAASDASTSKYKSLDEAFADLEDL